MAVPVITSVTFDKTSYAVGDTITATVKYSVPANATPESETFSPTATVTNPSTGEKASVTGKFTVTEGIVTAASGNAAMTGGQTGQTWTLVSDDHVSTATFHTKALALTPVTPPTGNANPIAPPANLAFSATGNSGETWDGFIVYNNTWNTAEVGPQEIWLENPGTSPFTFGAVSDQSTATPHVKSYPCIQLDGSWPVNGITSALASWQEGGPVAGTGIDYETAWDIFTTDNAKELMIWTRNVGQTPAGSKTATVTIAGVVYDVWTAGTTISYVAETGFATADNYDVAKVIADALARGFYVASDTITQFCFGWEICETDSKAMNFSASGFEFAVVAGTPGGTTTPPAGAPVVITDPNGGPVDFPYAAQPGFSDWPNHDGAQVMQGVNNPGAGLVSQVLTATSLADWSVAANLKAGNGAVISYPATQNWLSQSTGGPFAIAGMNTLTSEWAVTVPADNAGDDYEAAYDLWTQGEAAFAKAYGPIETMIWVYNHGQTPAGTKQANPVSIAGVSYDLWIRDDSSGQTYTLVMNTPALSGTADLLAVFKYLMANGHLDADSGIFGLSFGFELCSTHGVTETFGVTNLTMERS